MRVQSQIHSHLKQLAVGLLLVWPVMAGSDRIKQTAATALRFELSFAGSAPWLATPSAALALLSPLTVCIIIAALNSEKVSSPILSG